MTAAIIITTKVYRIGKAQIEVPVVSFGTTEWDVDGMDPSDDEYDESEEM